MWQEQQADLVSLLPFLEESGGQQLEQMVSHFVIADEQPLGPSLHRCIHPIPAHMDPNDHLECRRGRREHALAACTAVPAHKGPQDQLEYSCINAEEEEGNRHQQPALQYLHKKLTCWRMRC